MDSNPGAFGQPGTNAVLLGGRAIDFGAIPGFRISGGYWFGDQARWGIEASFFVLAQQTLNQGIASDDFGNPGIYRPIHDVNFGETALYVALPNMAAGTMVVSSRSQLLGTEVNGLFRLVQCDNWNLSLLGGFRFLNLDETINVSTYTNDFAGVLTGPGNPQGLAEVPGSTLAVFDHFHTSNQFYGGQLGGQATYAFGRLYLTGRAQVGLGDTFQTINISGATVQNQPGVGVAYAPAGALATASNIGRYTHNAFTVVPEFQLKLGYQFGRFVSAYLGYDFLYWSNVVRPGNTISRNVDLQGIPTGGLYNPSAQLAAPGPPSFTQSGFWAQGITFGLQFTF
jgi:hypothetical protein